MDNFIIGLTGAFGSGCTVLGDGIFVNQLNYKKYTLSDILKEMFNKEYGHPHSSRHELQDYGNKLRENHKADFLAKEVVKKINIDQLPPSQNIVIDGIRNPYEINYFRQLYPNFFLVAIFADYDKRWNRVKSIYNNSIDAFNEDDYKDQGTDEPEYGQKISTCFFEADLILANNDHINWDTPNNAYFNMISSIDNYLKAFQDPNSSHPTINESLMAMAYTNGRRSKCKKRRVGAIVVDEYKNILSSGFNDVPKKFEDCVGKYGECYRDIFRKELKSYVLEELGSLENKSDLAKNIIKKIKVLELCRALHAEETALLNLVTSSSRTDFSNCTLYVTTYPCNLCANKIVQIGIKNVVYFEPYPVEEAKEIFEKSDVKATPFQGVTFRAFFKAFTFKA